MSRSRSWGHTVYDLQERLPLTDKKGKRKVQGVPQSQTAAPPRPQEEEETDNLNKHKPNKRTKSTKISSLFPKRGNRNTKRTEKKTQEQNGTRKDIQQIAS